MKLPALLAARGAAALFAVLALLAACTPVVVVEDPQPEPRFCTQEYDPVCGRRGGERETFANSCIADQAGYRVIQRGECRRERAEPRACTREFDPVCGRRGDDQQTFTNSCQAEVAGYRVIREGECRRGGGGRGETICTREYRPVCARRGRDVQTFPNACEARASEFRVVSDGEC